MVGSKIRAYFGKIAGDPHHRYRSWEHCYRFFHDANPTEIVRQRELAALNLGFYLASWGMYRGSTFLINRAYTVHLPVIDCLASSRFAPLWQREFGSKAEDADVVPIIMDAVEAIGKAYTKANRQFNPTPTLITKVLLGTFGCLPACDTYFIAGFRHAGLGYSYLYDKFVEKVLKFSLDHLSELRKEQVVIKKHSGTHYPLMKLVDMYFWQLGYEGAGQPGD